MEHSKGNWKIGNFAMTVVTDNGEGFVNHTGHGDVKYYGGYLIAESILKPADAKLIAAAPDLCRSLCAILDTIENDVQPDNLPLYSEIQDAKAAIQKATK